jgi:hypothetical protein
MLLYGMGAALSVMAARGSRRSGALLAAGAGGYLALFVGPAQRELRWGRALTWVPVLRVTVDLAKMHGFMVGSLASLLTRANHRWSKYPTFRR